MHIDWKGITRVVSLILMAAATAAARADVPYIPRGEGTSIRSSATNGSMVARVSVTLPTPCHYVASWGVPIRDGSTFYFDAEFLVAPTVACVQILTTVSHSYELGALSDGAYRLVFRVWGQIVQETSFAIATPHFRGRFDLIHASEIEVDLCPGCGLTQSDESFALLVNNGPSDLTATDLAEATFEAAVSVPGFRCALSTSNLRQNAPLRALEAVGSVVTDRNGALLSLLEDGETFRNTTPSQVLALSISRDPTNHFVGDVTLDWTVRFVRQTVRFQTRAHVGLGDRPWRVSRAGRVASAPIPYFDAEPADRFAYTGDDVVFSALAVGSSPLRYQWYFEGQLLVGATNAQLALSGVTPADSGRYWVVVTNFVGNATSRQARLQVRDALVGIARYSGLTITGRVGQTYVVRYADGLAVTNRWVPLATNTLVQPEWFFVDRESTRYPRRFYRVDLQP